MTSGTQTATAPHCVSCSTSAIRLASRSEPRDLHMALQVTAPMEAMPTRGQSSTHGPATSITPQDRCRPSATHPHVDETTNVMNQKEENNAELIRLLVRPTNPRPTASVLFTADLHSALCLFYTRCRGLLCDSSSGVVPSSQGSLENEQFRATLDLFRRTWLAVLFPALYQIEPSLVSTSSWHLILFIFADTQSPINMSRMHRSLLSFPPRPLSVPPNTNGWRKKTNLHRRPSSPIPAPPPGASA